jgi:hypothetical protein
VYGKIFEQMYDGTLSADWKAMVTFQQFIVLADSQGIVDYTPPALSRRTGIPLDILEHGIEKLQEPDPYSRSSDFDGRRITLLDENRPWGWEIVNYAHYRDLASREDKREKDRIRIANMRKGLKDKDAAENRNESQPVADVAHVDANADVDVDELPTTAPAVPKEPPEFAEFKEIYPLRSGSQPWSRALKVIRVRLREGDHWDAILAGAKRYADYCEATAKTGTEFVMQAATFCDPDKHYLESWEPPPTKSKLRQNQNIDAAQEFLEASNE